MSESIWGKVAPTGFSLGQNSFNTQLYTIFNVSESTTLAGISFYSNSVATLLPIATGIFEVGNTTPIYTNTSPTWDGAAGSGWVTTTNETAISLSAGTDYIVCVVGPSDAAGNSWLCFITPDTFPITNGAVTAPASSGALTNSPYIDGGANATPIYPTSSTDIEWFVDVQLTPASSPVTGTGDVTVKKVSVSGSGSSSASAITGSGDISASKTTPSGVGILQETFSAVFNSTDANGIKTYDITASGNSSVAGSHPTRILEPTSPSDAYPHSFLYLFPVEPDQGTTFGDPLQIAFDNGWHNTYNVTIIQPGYAIDPWYADNDTDHTILQERFTLDVVDWVTTNFALTGREKNYLMGFSKSGTGGAQLIFRNPGVFDVAALWDFPADMATYNRFDPSETTVMGDASNFSAYELSSANISA